MVEETEDKRRVLGSVKRRGYIRLFWTNIRRKVGGNDSSQLKLAKNGYRAVRANKLESLRRCREERASNNGTGRGVMALMSANNRS